jgi:Tfp pilus assembly protein PilO
VSLTSRDRKIVMGIVPLALFLVYWFMILSPKQSEGDKVASELTQAQTKRDAAEQQVTQLNAAKASFASDYATVIRLGKAIPTTVDMPTLLVQLNNAAKGTGVHIQDLKPGQTTVSPSGGSGTAGGSAQGGSGQSGTSSQSGSTPPGGGSNPAAPGSAPAQSFPGKQAQKAGNAVTQSNNQSQSAANATANGPGSTGTAGATASSSAASAPGLSTVPLSFTLKGNFFNLADFFHRLKRFVRVVNHQIEVRGRLLSVDSFQFQKAQNGSPNLLQATVSATVYLSPADQGLSAGATATGPQAPAGGGPASTPAGGASTNPVTPTAAATP